MLAKKIRNKKGFTLIELIVVIAILGILAAIIIPRFTGFQEKARATQALVDAKQIATAIDSFEAENDAWPDDATDEAEIRTLSGIAGGTLVITEPEDGSFEYTTASGHTAGRNIVGGVPGPVVMNP